MRTSNNNAHKYSLLSSSSSRQNWKAVYQSYKCEAERLNIKLQQLTQRCQDLFEQLHQRTTPSSSVIPVSSSSQTNTASVTVPNVTPTPQPTFQPQETVRFVKLFVGENTGLSSGDLVIIELKSNPMYWIAKVQSQISRASKKELFVHLYGWDKAVETLRNDGSLESVHILTIKKSNSSGVDSLPKPTVLPYTKVSSNFESEFMALSIVSQVAVILKQTGNVKHIYRRRLSPESLEMIMALADPTDQEYMFDWMNDIDSSNREFPENELEEFINEYVLVPKNQKIWSSEEMRRQAGLLRDMEIDFKNEQKSLSSSATETRSSRSSSTNSTNPTPGSRRSSSSLPPPVSEAEIAARNKQYQEKGAEEQHQLNLKRMEEREKQKEVADRPHLQRTISYSAKLEAADEAKRQRLQIERKTREEEERRQKEKEQREREELEKERREREKRQREQEQEIKRLQQEETIRREEQEKEVKRLQEEERRQEEQRRKEEEDRIREEQRRKMEEETMRRKEEQRRKEEEDRIREEQRRKMEEETMRRKEEQRRKEEEEEKDRIREEQRRKMEEEKMRRKEEQRRKEEEEMRRKEEQRRKEEEEEKDKIREEQRRKREEEEIRRKEEQRRKEEEEEKDRIREGQRRKREEEEIRRREEEQRRKMEEEEIRRKEEQKRKEEEEKEKDRIRGEQRRKREEERRQEEEREKEIKRLEDEAKRQMEKERVEEEERMARETAMAAAVASEKQREEQEIRERSKRAEEEDQRRKSLEKDRAFFIEENKKLEPKPGKKKPLSQREEEEEEVRTKKVKQQEMLESEEKRAKMQANRTQPFLTEEEREEIEILIKSESQELATFASADLDKDTPSEPKFEDIGRRGGLEYKDFTGTILKTICQDYATMAGMYEFYAENTSAAEGDVRTSGLEKALFTNTKKNNFEHIKLYAMRKGNKKITKNGTDTYEPNYVGFMVVTTQNKDLPLQVRVNARTNVPDKVAQWIKETNDQTQTKSRSVAIIHFYCPLLVKETTGMQTRRKTKSPIADQVITENQIVSIFNWMYWNLLLVLHNNKQFIRYSPVVLVVPSRKNLQDRNQTDFIKQLPFDVWQGTVPPTTRAKARLTKRQENAWIPLYTPTPTPSSSLSQIWTPEQGPKPNEVYALWETGLIQKETETKDANEFVVQKTDIFQPSIFPNRNGASLESRFGDRELHYFVSLTPPLAVNNELKR